MRWLAFGCKYDFVVCFYSLFLFCIYIAEEHTRHASMCFTVAEECVLPLYKKHMQCHTYTNTRRHKQTQMQATGSRSTLQHTGQSTSVKLFPPLPPPPPSALQTALLFLPTFSLLPQLSINQSSLNLTYLEIFITQLRTLSAFTHCSPLFSCHVSYCILSFLCPSQIHSLLSPLLLSVCLTAVVGFCIALFFSQTFFSFVFWDSIYLYK